MIEALLVVMLKSTAAVESEQAVLEPVIHGIELGVADLDEARRFYVDGLGFRLERTGKRDGQAVLRHGDVRLSLRRTTGHVAPRGSARLYLNMHVADLETAARRATRAGARMTGDPAPFALGMALAVEDPHGNPLNLLDLEGREPAAGPEVFNVSLRVPDIARAERQLTGLGFRVWTRDYLPETLVFERHGALSVVVHRVEPGAEGQGDRGALVLAVDDLAATRSRLASAGMRIGGDRSPLLELPDLLAGVRFVERD